MMRKLVLLLLAASVTAFVWANNYFAPIDAYRSPLKDAPPQPAAQGDAALSRRVVMVLVDGLRLDVSQDNRVMPTLEALRAQGLAVSMRSRAPSYSAPAYAVLFTGAWQNISDGAANNLAFADYQPWTQDNLFAAAKRAGMKTAVGGYYWFERFIPPPNRDVSLFVEGEDAAADASVLGHALPWLDDPAYRLVLIHLDQVDHAGHTQGGDSQAYRDAARRVDEALGKIAARLDWNKDTLLVFSDHGHLDRGGHGGSERVVTTQPFVMVGAGVVAQKMAGEMPMVDVAPSVAALLGLPLPASAQGAPLWEGIQWQPGQRARAAQAWSAQQEGLVSAYRAAVGGDANLGDEPRRPERVLSALVLLGLAAWAAWHWRGPDTFAVIQAALIYALSFHVLHSFVFGLDYTISWVAGSEDLLIHVGICTAAAFLAAWLYLRRRLAQEKRPSGARQALLLGAAVMAVAAGLVTAHLAWNGPWPTTYLPEAVTFFLGLLGLVQILFIGPLAALLGLALWLAQDWGQRRPTA